MRLIVRTRVFALASARGWNDAELARRMGISRVQINRVRGGKRGIGWAFTAGACRAFPEIGMDQLFEVSWNGHGNVAIVDQPRADAEPVSQMRGLREGDAAEVAGG